MAERTTEEAKDLIRAYKDVFLGSSDGQKVFWDLINECHVFRAFKQQNAGAYLKEGKRELGLHLFRMVEFNDSPGGPGPARMRQIIESINNTSKTLKNKEDKK